jgi:hypothetical protein
MTHSCNSSYTVTLGSETEASRTNGPARRTSRGLLLRKGVWHIDKMVYGTRICESPHTGDLAEAGVLLAHRASEARRLHHYGRPFREAGVKRRRLLHCEHRSCFTTSTRRASNPPAQERLRPRSSRVAAGDRIA